MKKIKNYDLNHKKRIILFASMLCLMVALALFGTYGFTKVHIIGIEETVAFRILKGKTVGDAVTQSGINVPPESRLSHDVHMRIVAPLEITIYEAREIIVGNSEKIATIKTALNQEEDIFKAAGLEYDENKETYVSFNFDKPIYYQLSKNEKIVSATQTIKYKTTKIDNAKLEIGQSKVAQKGKNGKAQTLSVVINNSKNKTLKKTPLASKTISKAVEKKIEVGVKPFAITADGKAYTSYKTLTVEATAYCSCSICCGPYDGSTTADGSPTKTYHTVAAAADYAFGTKLYIPYFSEASNGGIFEVEDRGGAIQGNRIDIYFSTHEQALRFGRRALEIYVLE